MTEYKRHIFTDRNEDRYIAIGHVQWSSMSSHVRMDVDLYKSLISINERVDNNSSYTFLHLRYNKSVEGEMIVE